MTHETTSPAFFENKYKASNDPWAFASSSYELGRYQAIMDALRHRRYRHAFEPACSIGVLTEQLATLCDRVDAIDISPTAVAAAAARCSALAHVHTTCDALPGFLPAAALDLVVFSELGYYFEENVLRALVEEILARMSAGGVFLAVHWLGHSDDHLLSGDRVHEILAETPGLRLEITERHLDVQRDRCGFRLDRWVRA
jgi:SAM-dependent methyltransferase